jgi:TonB family protein
MTRPRVLRILWPLLALVVSQAGLADPPAPADGRVVIMQAKVAKGSNLGTACSTYYPSESRHLHEEGRTTLLVYIAPTGRVTDTRIEKSSGIERIDEAAVRCVTREGRFEPQLVDGTPVGSWQRMRWTWRFDVDALPIGSSEYYGAIAALARKGEFDKALPRAQKALADAHLAAEREIALRLLVHVTGKMKDYPHYAEYAAQLLEASPAMPAYERADYLKAIAHIHAQLQHPDVALEWTRRWIDLEPDLEAYEFAGRIELAQHHDAAAIPWLRASIAASAQPTEQVLGELYGAYRRTGAATDARATLEALLARYPKRDYLLLLAGEYLPGSEARARLQLLRLLHDRDALATPAAVLVYADAAMAAGSPGEAKAAIEKSLFQKPEGFGADEARARELLDRARQQAEEARRTLPTLEAEARPTDRADGDAAIGFGYLGLGEDAKAVAAFERALAPARRATLERPDDATLALGIAQLHLGHCDAALEEFREAGKDERMAHVATLWNAAARIAPTVAAPKSP